MFDIDKILGKKQTIKGTKDPFNNIFGLEKKQQQPTVVNPNIIDMFKGKGHPRPGDRITKPQRRAMKKDPWGDWDKDGVINGLDCAPKNPKKHMAWRNPKPYQHVEMMHPRTFLRKTGSEDFGQRRMDVHGMIDAPQHQMRYHDYETNNMQPIDRLGKLIKSKDREVSMPFVADGWGEHEGRHRAFAAERAGMDEIPVRTPAPKEWRTDGVFEKFKKHATHLDIYGQYEDEWKSRIQEKNFPEEYMDDKSREAYTKALHDEGVIKK